LRALPLRRALLPPSGSFDRLELLDSVPSTNAELASRAARGGWSDLSVLAADHQSAGRGRLGRTWTAPARTALAASVLLRPGPAVPVGTWSWLPLLAGVSIVEALRAVAGVDASVKWPNDVLVSVDLRDGAPQKVCGVLSEVVPTPEGQAVVLGFGLNVRQTREELPVPTATSLLLAGAATTDRDTVLRACLRSLAVAYLAWKAAGGNAVACGLAAVTREACSTLGQHVRVELPGGVRPLEGVAEGLDDEGRLLVRPLAGPSGQAGQPGQPGQARVVAVAAGDVVHLVPSGAPGEGA
jgi:BirA family transcriptional regulator, biotin operon repressor / biotin---[acetyl-CoA-carboxylase] ligase